MVRLDLLRMTVLPWLRLGENLSRVAIRGCKGGAGGEKRCSASRGQLG